MFIETEDGSNGSLAHCVKTCAVHEAEFLSSGQQKRIHRRVVALIRDPIDGEERDSILVERTKSSQSKAVLHQGARFNYWSASRSRRAVIGTRSLHLTGGSNRLGPGERTTRTCPQKQSLFKSLGEMLIVVDADVVVSRRKLAHDV